ncbi:hypothetical protein EMPS_03696 [Entomortierella parvispora]|uniref:Transmembrane protein n=1 Tax=Entomortierella parvispora TaxID=205924 RepID=A0A9P3H752_9FUNG|nr:hypothetical protein EMPS_03696 [Entomortierella parvispora]
MYFLRLELPGFIGFICTVLVGLFGIALSSLYNFYDSNNLHYRVAASGGLSGSLKLFLHEFLNMHRRRGCCSCCFATGMLVLVLFSATIPFIVTSGIKPGTGIHYGDSCTWSTAFSYDPLDTNTPSFLLLARGNYSVVLSNLYQSINGLQYTSDCTDEGIDFKVVSQATNTTICGVNTNYLGPVPCDHPTPGTISLTRQLYTYSQNSTPTCEATSDNCEVMSMRTTLASWADYTMLFETPWTVMYNDHEGNSIPIANISGAPGTANSYETQYLAERPTTVLVGYPEKNGVSVMATFTTASFQTAVVEDFTFSWTAQVMIGSAHPLLTPILNAFNASISTPPLIGDTASNRVTVAYNAPSALSDNTTQITCVLYEVNLPRPERPIKAVHRISCRELRIAVMLNTGAQPNSSYPHYSMVKMYNALSPNQMENSEFLRSQSREIGGPFKLESLDTVADDVVQLLGNITERLYPFAAIISAEVQGYSYEAGITFEHWSFVFMITLTCIVVVIYIVDRVVNDEYARMGFFPLIEKTTKTAKSKSFVYPRWRLVNDGGRFHVLLRGQRITVIDAPETERLKLEETET